MCDSDSTEPPEQYPFDIEGRYKFMLHSGSYYFAVTRAIAPELTYDSNGSNWTITSRSNLKNYDNEIEKFLAWLKPYVEQGSGSRDFYAIVCYEEQEEPTIYYLRDKET